MKFPSNPNKGDELTIGKSQYVFNGVGWIPSTNKPKKNLASNLIKKLFNR